VALASLPKWLVTVGRSISHVRRCSDDAGHGNKSHVGEVDVLQPIHADLLGGLAFRVSLRSMWEEGLRGICILGLV
jgi:hypothetical protein